MAGDQAETWHGEGCRWRGSDWRGKAGREGGLGVALSESRILMIGSG